MVKMKITWLILTSIIFDIVLTSQPPRTLQQTEPTELQRNCIIDYDVEECKNSGVNDLEFYLFQRTAQDIENRVLRIGIWIRDFEEDPYDLLESNSINKHFKIEFSHKGYEDDDSWKGNQTEGSNENQDKYNVANQSEYGYNETKYSNSTKKENRILIGDDEYNRKFYGQRYFIGKRKLEEDEDFGFEAEIDGVNLWFYPSDGSMTLELEFSEDISSTELTITVKNPFLVFNGKDFFVTRTEFSHEIQLVTTYF